MEFDDDIQNPVLLRAQDNPQFVDEVIHSMQTQPRIIHKCTNLDLSDPEAYSLLWKEIDIKEATFNDRFINILGPIVRHLSNNQIFRDGISGQNSEDLEHFVNYLAQQNASPFHVTQIKDRLVEDIPSNEVPFFSILRMVRVRTLLLRCIQHFLGTHCQRIQVNSDIAYLSPRAEEVSSPKPRTHFLGNFAQNNKDTLTSKLPPIQKQKEILQEGNKHFRNLFKLFTIPTNPQKCSSQVLLNMNESFIPSNSLTKLPTDMTVNSHPILAIPMLRTLYHPFHQPNKTQDEALIHDLVLKQKAIQLSESSNYRVNNENKGFSALTSLDLLCPDTKALLSLNTTVKVKYVGFTDKGLGPNDQKDPLHVQVNYQLLHRKNMKTESNPAFQLYEEDNYHCDRKQTNMIIPFEFQTGFDAQNSILTSKPIVESYLKNDSCFLIDPVVILGNHLEHDRFEINAYSSFLSGPKPTLSALLFASTFVGTCEAAYNAQISNLKHSKNPLCKTILKKLLE